MSFLDRFSLFQRKASSQALSGRMAVVHWDRDSVSYFVLTPNARQVKGSEIGTLRLTLESNESSDVSPDDPRTAKPLVALAEHFKDQKISVKGVVVLLSRPELDLLPLNLPPASSDELPSLVATEVEQQQGESPDPPIIDFYSPPVQPGIDSQSPGTQQVFAFALSQRQMAALHEQCTTAGFKLLAVGSRQLAPLRLLHESKIERESVVIAMHLFAGEAEIAICQGNVPVLLRTLRYSAEDPERVAEQIDTEAKRCLTLLPQELSERSVSWCIFETGDFARNVGAAIEQQEQVHVQWIAPYLGWNVIGPAASDGVHSAANSGAALDILGQSLPVNLLAPKKPPVPPNPWIRWGTLGGLSTAAAATVGYFLLTDVWDLQDQVKGLETNYRDESKVTAKYQEKSDQVATIEGWLTDQVDWVAELADLAGRLPDGQDATVRRLSGAVNAKGSGSIDLAMQVRSQEVISELENRIRGAKYTIVSKQITQNPDSQEYPWQFESHIEFPLTPPGLRRFRSATLPDEPKPKQRASKSEGEKNDKSPDSSPPTTSESSPSDMPQKEPEVAPPASNTPQSPSPVAEVPS